MQRTTNDITVSSGRVEEVVTTLAIDAIRIGKRLRDADTKSSEYRALLADIDANGLIQPIVLFKLGNNAPRLVAGLHRLTALKSLGTKQLEHGKHFVWLDTTDMTPRRAVLQYKLTEASENLRRIELPARLRKLFINRQEKLCFRIVGENKRSAQSALDANKLASDKAAVEAKAKAKRNPSRENVDAATRAEAARVKAAMAARRNEEAYATLSSGRVEEVVTRIPNGVRDEVEKLTGLSRGELANISYATRHLYSFISPDDLSAHRIAKLIDETPGQYRILESLAVPSSKAYHDGLRDWCDRIRAGKGVELPDQLKENIKNKNAEAAKLEAQKDVHKAKRAAIDLFAELYSNATRTIEKIRAHTKAAGHEEVIELYKAEQANLEKLRQLASEIKDRTYQRTA